MKEPYMEGVANRHVPRPCVRRGNASYEVSLVQGKAQAGTLSSEIIISGLSALLLEEVGETSCPLCREGMGEPAESKTPCERGRFMRENRESPESARLSAGRSGKASGR